MAKARERVLGVADRVAAIIAKEGREPVVGYEPQLARSRGGLVTALIVESLEKPKAQAPRLLPNPWVRRSP